MEKRRQKAKKTPSLTESSGSVGGGRTLLCLWRSLTGEGERDQKNAARERDRGEGKRGTVSESTKTGRGQAEHDRTGQAEGRRGGGGRGRGVGDASLSGGLNVGKTQKTLFGIALRATGSGLPGGGGAYQQEIAARSATTDKTRDRVGGDRPDADPMKVSTHLNRSRLQQTAEFMPMSA